MARRLNDFAWIRPRKQQSQPTTDAKMKSPMAGGIRADAASAASLPEPLPAVVFTVRAVVAWLAPGVTLAGENEYVQPLGNPVQLSDTAELKAPNCGVTRTV